MSLRVKVLASGSKGNAALYSSENTHVLLDCGISARRVAQGLAKEKVDPGDLAGIFISHEHTDHVQGLRVFLKKTAAPLFIAPESYETHACENLEPRGVEPLVGGSSVILGPMTITPFLIPHDAASCFGFVFQSAGVKIAQVTDLGTATSLVRERVRGSNCLLLEFNHDLERLLNGTYPLDIKMRIKSTLGHLSNAQAAELVGETLNGECRALYLMHMSKSNNLPELAELAARERLGGDVARIFRTFEDKAAEAWEG